MCWPVPCRKGQGISVVIFNLHGLKRVFLSFFEGWRSWTFETEFLTIKTFLAMSLLTLLVTLFFAVSDCDGRSTPPPTTDQPTMETPDYVISDLIEP